MRVSHTHRCYARQLNLEQEYLKQPHWPHEAATMPLHKKAGVSTSNECLRNDSRIIPWIWDGLMAEDPITLPSSGYSRLPENRVEHVAASIMVSARPKMSQHVGIRNAGIFEGICENDKPVRLQCARRAAVFISCLCEPHDKPFVPPEDCEVEGDRLKHVPQDAPQ